MIAPNLAPTSSATAARVGLLARGLAVLVQEPGGQRGDAQQPHAAVAAHRAGDDLPPHPPIEPVAEGEAQHHLQARARLERDPRHAALAQAPANPATGEQEARVQVRIGDVIGLDSYLWTGEV